MALIWSVLNDLKRIRSNYPSWNNSGTSGNGALYGAGGGGVGGTGAQGIVVITYTVVIVVASSNMLLMF